MVKNRVGLKATASWANAYRGPLEKALKLTLRSNVISADVTDALRQIEETYGTRVVSLAAELPAFERMGALCISPHAQHPLLGAVSRRRGSYHVATNAYHISAELNYVEFASSDWRVRLTAYAKAVEEAVSNVPPARLAIEEGKLLVGSVKQALGEVAENAPKQVAIVGPVYVGTTGGMGPTFSYTSHAGMTRVELEDISRHKPVHADQEERLFKLYRKIDGRLHYREGWIADELTVVQHEGLCGDKGDTREHVLETAVAARKTYVQLKQTARDEGFRAIPQSKHAKLVVEFRIDGMGSGGDIDRRHSLEDFLEHVVGWLGLGHLDGGSTGSGTMEAMCLVVDFKIAKAAVEQALRGSDFSDFECIYREQ